MLRSYKYRLYPAVQQEGRLKRTLASLCDFKRAPKRKGGKIQERQNQSNKSVLRRLALEKRRTNEELKQVHSQVVQNVADRVSMAFRNFFKRDPGSRRTNTKGITGRSSILSRDSVSSLLQKDTRLYLSGVGKMRIFIHRPMSGKVNRLCIKYEAGEWYGIFLIEQKGCHAAADRDRY